MLKNKIYLNAIQCPEICFSLTVETNTQELTIINLLAYDISLMYIIDKSVHCITTFKVIHI